MFNGQGTYTLADGSQYVGGYRDGKYNGQGTFTWVSGNKYVGAFVDDQISGKGAKYYMSGKVEEGLWENGKLIEEMAISDPASDS